MPASKQPSPTSARDDRIAVVVITRNRRDSLDQTLHRLCALPEQPQVIVVDNASTDGTLEMLEHNHPSVRAVPVDRNLGAAARTIGVVAADAPYIAFADDDSWWAPGALRAAADMFERFPSVALINGRILVGDQNRLDPTCALMAASPVPSSKPLPGPSLLGFVACGAVVRREAFLSVGGFHPEFEVGGEETLVALDLAAGGWDLCYVDGIVAHHHPSPSRSSHDRRRRMLRNAVFTAVLRLSPREVGASLWACVRQALREPAARAALSEVIARVPAMLADRRRVPAHVEASWRLL